jgi:hypothetical protein
LLVFCCDRSDTESEGLLVDSNFVMMQVKPSIAFAHLWMCHSASTRQRPAVTSLRNGISSRWDGLSLEFVSLKVPVEQNAAGPASLRLFIEGALSEKGRPVRWAIVKADEKSLTVDGVVSCVKEAVVELGIFSDDDSRNVFKDAPRAPPHK